MTMRGGLLVLLLFSGVALAQPYSSPQESTVIQNPDVVAVYWGAQSSRR